MKDKLGRKIRHATYRKGSVSVIMALSITFIMGCGALAVDYGVLVADANRLQRACDAGALAGAMKLKTTGVDVTDEYNAKVDAQRVAFQNGVTVNFNDITVTNGTTIRMLASTSRTLFFARALGQRTGAITRSSTAGVAAGDNLSTGPGRIRVAPIGISWESYNAYNADRVNPHDIELVRQNKQTFGLDDAVLFDLRNNNAKSGAKMQDQLTGAAVEYSSIGDYETTLNAAQSSEKKKLEDGLQILFDRSAAAPWNDSDDVGNKYSQILNGTSPMDNPRIVYLIVTPSTTNPSNGTYNTQVQGFVPVYIEDYYYTTVGTVGKGNGKKSGGSSEDVLRMTLRFLPPSSASDGQVKIKPGASLSGIRVVSLTN